jgi:hypothetical protein
LNQEELENQLNTLLSLESENEVVEFKEAKNNFYFNRLGKYFSALSNKDLSLGDIILLDNIQKKKMITANEENILEKKVWLKVENRIISSLLMFLKR